MKNISTNLKNRLSKTALTISRCVRLELSDGTIKAFTNAQFDITYDSIVYKAGAHFLDYNVVSKNDLSVSNLDIQGILSAEEIDESDLAAGKYDYATFSFFLIDRTHPEYGILKGVKGSIGEVRIERNTYYAEIRGLAQELQQTQGSLYQYDCRADVFDDKCSLDVNAHKVTGTVTSVASNRQFTDSSRVESDDFFTVGKLTFTSGNNSGISREVKVFATSEFMVYDPFPYDISISDAYEVYPGCDKKLATCRDKFDNVINFRGEPHIPGEQALTYE